MVEIKEFQAYSLSDIEANIAAVKEFLYEKEGEKITPLLVKKTKKPSLFLYRIDYNHPQTGNDESVYGFVSLMRVDDPDGKKSVFGHERIFQDRAEDLYECFKECGVQFNPIVAIYKDYSKLGEELLAKAGSIEPIIDTKIDTPEARHRVWAFDDPELIAKVKETMTDRRVILADGHHRYKAAEIMSEKDKVPWVMTMFVDVNSPGLLLLPWHRVLKELDMDKFLSRLHDPIYGFRVYETKTREDMLAALKLCDKADIEGRVIVGRKPHSKKGAWQCLSQNIIYFGLQFKGRDKYFLITIDDIKLAEMAAKIGEKVCLELTLLHFWLVNRVIPKATPVEYLSSVEEVEAAITKNGYELGIYLPAMTKDEIILKAVWEKKPVPEKATCFRPKAKTGVIFWSIPGSKKPEEKPEA